MDDEKEIKDAEVIEEVTLPPQPHKPRKGNMRQRLVPFEDLPKAIVPKPNNDEQFQVFNLLRRGYSETEIRKMYAGNTKKAARLIAQARKMQKEAMLDYDKSKADVLDKLWYNYRLAEQVGNIRDATSILQTIAKIQGLTRDVNVEGSQFITVWAK